MGKEKEGRGVRGVKVRKWQGRECTPGQVHSLGQYAH